MTKKRLAVKWIRDGAKAAYKKQGECFICGNTEELELHHVHGMTNLLETWAKRNKIDISTDEAVLEIRDRFIAEHHKEIYEDVFTLCASHHDRLHSVYGKSPLLSTAPKQVRWIQTQKDKLNGITKELNRVDDKTESSPGENSPRGRFSSWY